MSTRPSPLPGEEPWVPPPIDGDLFWPRRKIFGGEAKWTRYTLKTHQTCTTCVEVLQDHEKQAYERQPPHPSAAALVRSGPNGKTWHCMRHGEELRRRDDAVAERLKDLRAHQAHLARGVRPR